MDWTSCNAAIWRGKRQSIQGAKHIDPVTFVQLVGIDEHKAALINNSERFLPGNAANYVLLWGARGTGKSSLITAVLNAHRRQGLRWIEVDKYDLLDFPEIVDDIRDSTNQFILYCDELSFEADDPVYNVLKSVLEGTIEQAQKNIIVYATSNRRHLMPQAQQDNLDALLRGHEINYPNRRDDYFDMADACFPQF